MKVGDVIRHNGEKYTITCFYAPVFVNGVETTKVVDTCYSDIQHLSFVKVAAVRHYEGYNRYVHIPIENVTPLKNYIKEFQKADGLWTAFKVALNFSDTSYREELSWKNDDLVPNPGESKRKRFKLF